MVLLGGCSRDSGLPNCAGDACFQSPDFGPASEDLTCRGNESDLAGVDAAALCSAPEGPVHPYSEAEALALVVGLWAQCTGKPIGKSDTFGLEFTKDRRWYALQRDGAGNVVRASGGFDSQGTFIILGGPQFDLNFPDGGQHPFHVAFEDSPRKMLTGDPLGEMRTYAGL
jgi:hypothetical protein